MDEWFESYEDLGPHGLEFVLAMREVGPELAALGIPVDHTQAWRFDPEDHVTLSLEIAESFWHGDNIGPSPIYNARTFRVDFYQTYINFIETPCDLDCYIDPLAPLGFESYRKLEGDPCALVSAAKEWLVSVASQPLVEMQWRSANGVVTSVVSAPHSSNPEWLRIRHGDKEIIAKFLAGAITPDSRRVVFPLSPPG